MSYLVNEQVIANEIVRKHGFEPVSTMPLCDYSHKYFTDVVACVAIKGDERFAIRVSTKKKKVLSCDLVVVQYDRNDPKGEKILFAKRFARKIS